MIKNSKKETTIFVLIIIFGVLLLANLSDAKFLDLWNTITGRAPTQTASLSITVGNNPPVIGNVTLDEADSITLTENGNKSFLFSFVAVDPEGLSNIVDGSAVANITRSGETTRHNNTFVYNTDGGCRFANNVGTNGKNFSCTIGIVFYDGAGLWNISVMVNDSNGNFAQNTTKPFTIQESTNIALDQSSITFPSVTLNQNNVSASINVTITNTGNDDISGRESTGETINITAITLVPSTGTTFIPASNFTIAEANGSGTNLINPCDFSITNNVTRLRNMTDAVGFSNFTGAINGSAVLARAVGNKQVYALCLIHAPNDLQSTTYSTTSSGSWTILAF